MTSWRYKLLASISMEESRRPKYGRSRRLFANVVANSLSKQRGYSRLGIDFEGLKKWGKEWSVNFSLLDILILLLASKQQVVWIALQAAKNFTLHFFSDWYLLNFLQALEYSSMMSGLWFKRRIGIFFILEALPCSRSHLPICARSCQECRSSCIWMAGCWYAVVSIRNAPLTVS